jgi:hypothetical protein
MNQFGIVTPTSPAIELEHPAHGREHLTAVVLGLPFGGTSMVAGTVEALGIPLATSLDYEFCYEDSEINNPPLEQVRSTIADWNERHPVWGFKDPHAKRHDAVEFHASLRNPHYVIVCKDLASMTARLVQNPIRADDGGIPMDRLRYEVWEHVAFMQWVLTLPPAPKLLVSYHAALRNPGEMCLRLSLFLHLEMTSALLQKLLKAVDRISPNGGYLTKEDTECPT